VLALPVSPPLKQRHYERPRRGLAEVVLEVTLSVPTLPIPGLPVPTLPIPTLSIPGLPIPTLPIPGLPIPTLPIPGLPIPGLPIPRLPIPGLPKFNDFNKLEAGAVPILVPPVPKEGEDCVVLNLGTEPGYCNDLTELVLPRAFLRPLLLCGELSKPGDRVKQMLSATSHTRTVHPR
jgi:hypothetical protein